MTMIKLTLLWMATSGMLARAAETYYDSVTAGQG